MNYWEILNQGFDSGHNYTAFRDHESGGFQKVQKFARGTQKFARGTFKFARGTFKFPRGTWLSLSGSSGNLAESERFPGELG